MESYILITTYVWYVHGILLQMIVKWNLAIFYENFTKPRDASIFKPQILKLKI